MCGDRIIPVQHNQYNECWSPSSWRHQGIGTHDFDYVEPISSCLTRGRVPTTCIISVWGDDVNVKYIFYVSHEKCSTWRVNDFIPSMYIYIYIYIYIHMCLSIYIFTHGAYRLATCVGTTILVPSCSCPVTATCLGSGTHFCYGLPVCVADAWLDESAPF